MKMFRKKVERACQYCSYATELSEDNITCSKKNELRPLDSKCIHFKYDPLKRVPSKAKALDFSKYEEYDYSL